MHDFCGLNIERVKKAKSYQVTLLLCYFVTILTNKTPRHPLKNDVEKKQNEGVSSNESLFFVTFIQVLVQENLDTL